ncbi:50S ribosomal protein L34e [Candidatus Thorarchaeota archaeon]|nr:MAG: 50S ribosomal protein L34e [Candidatus Thorarchaeota archaeon]
MARPGELTRGRANRLVKTPGRRLVTHRQKFHKTSGTCYITGSKLQLPRGSVFGISKKTSKSAKRPNRPYGGVLSSEAMRRGLIKKIRE